MLITSPYSMRYVTIEHYAIYKQKFEEKYGRLKSKITDIFSNTKTEFYNDQDIKWSYEDYFYHSTQKIPMPLFIEFHSDDSLEHKYMINDYLIDQEGYDVGYITKDGERIK